MRGEGGLLHKFFWARDTYNGICDSAYMGGFDEDLFTYRRSVDSWVDSTACINEDGFLRVWEESEMQHAR